MESTRPGTSSAASPAGAAVRRAPEQVNVMLAMLYEELRSLAAAQLRRERRGHSFQPTDLVNEAYLRLAEQTQVEWRGRAHFMGIASQVVRRVLVDHARARNAGKRGGGRDALSLELVEPGDVASRGAVECLALNAALDALALLDPRQARVVELRFFGGLDVGETAELLGISPRTVKDDWRVARAWLSRRLATE
jgi:RNA polymerase sigma factor (TIGR02999 family)